MIGTLDRYLLKSLLIDYLIALSVMLSLYVVLDLFVNMDEFTEQKFTLVRTLRNIASYYGPNLLLYQAELSGVITLFACLATVARARRQNEMTAMLASGVSLYRVAAPVIAFGLCTTALLVVNTELLIPQVAHLLARDRDDVDGKHAYEVLFLRDRDRALVSAGRFHPNTRDLERLLVLCRDEGGVVVRTVEADRATWESVGPLPKQGKWRLQRGSERIRLEGAPSALGPQENEMVNPIEWYESDLSPEVIQLRQTEGWVRFLSVVQLDELLQSNPPDRASVVQTKHSRIAAPIVAMVLLMLGLPFFLDRSPANILNDAGWCMAVCGLCYVATFVAQSMRTSSESALPAWIPIFVFATLAMVLVDRIKT